LASDDSDIPPEVVKEGIRLYEEGKRLESCSEYKAAIDFYLESMRITFEDAVIWNDIASCYLILVQMDECEEALRRALEIDPDFVPALSNLSLVLLDTGRLKEAEKVARRATMKEPSNATPWAILGKILIQSGKYEKAEWPLKVALGIAKDDADSHDHMGTVYEHLGKIDEAESHFRRAVELRDDDAVIAGDYGCFLCRSERFEEAEAQLKKAVDLDPFDHVHLTNLAGALIGRVRKSENENLREALVEEAMKTLNKSLEINPAEGMSYFHWAEICIMHRKWKDAEDMLHHAMDVGLEAPMVYGLLCFVLGKMGMRTEAEEIFEEFKRRDQQHEYVRPRGDFMEGTVRS